MMAAPHVCTDPGRAPRCPYSVWQTCGSVWLPPTPSSYTHTHAQGHNLGLRCVCVCVIGTNAAHLSASSTDTFLSLSRSILLPAQRRTYYCVHVSVCMCERVCRIPPPPPDPVSRLSLPTIHKQMSFPNIFLSSFTQFFTCNNNHTGEVSLVTLDQTHQTDASFTPDAERHPCRQNQRVASDTLWSKLSLQKQQQHSLEQPCQNVFRTVEQMD